MKYLVDASVLSEPTKAFPSTKVVDWLRKNERVLTLCPVVLGELEYGILLLPAGTRRKRLEEWFASGVKRIKALDMDSVVASHWARLLAQLKRKGLAMPVKDSLIASTASAHGLTVATRNIQDFRNSGVKLVNPFGD